MATASASTRDQEVTLISVVNANETLASQTFKAYKGATPDICGNMSSQFHWGQVNAVVTGGGIRS